MRKKLRILEHFELCYNLRLTILHFTQQPVVLRRNIMYRTLQARGITENNYIISIPGRSYRLWIVIILSNKWKIVLFEHKYCFNPIVALISHSRMNSDVNISIPWYTLFLDKESALVLYHSQTSSIIYLWKIILITYKNKIWEA